MASMPNDDLICISPVDGSEYARRALHSDAAIEVAIQRARRAQLEWSRLSLEQRCSIVGRFVQAMEALNEEIVPELAWEMGRPICYGGELRSLVERVNGMLARAPKALASEVVEDGDLARRRISLDPVGLVLVIAPWNYPFLTAANTIIPALVAGNAVLLKHAAQTLLAGERFAQAFEMAGLPEGLFHNLFLSHDQTARLLASGVIGHATFTGSVEGGRAIERAAAGSFTNLTLELGVRMPPMCGRMPTWPGPWRAWSTEPFTTAASPAAVSSASM